MVEHVVRTAAKDLYTKGERKTAHIAYKAVRATRGKYTRAEPISALYEQKRVHHVGLHADLEDELCTWVPGEISPDRLDADVWGLTYLMLDHSEPSQAENTAW
jgi:phage terminase large subunit-like protein